MQGIVINFNAQKGYGFIRSKEKEESIFVHVTQVKNANSLDVGQEVQFEIEPTKKGLAAVNVFAGKKHRSPYSLFTLISLFIIVTIFALASQYLNDLIAYLIGINITTFILYGYDKYIASGEKLRVPELNLQGLALLGGSPAALFAQKFFRHKTVKGSFQIIYWLIVVGQVGLIVWVSSQKN